MRDKYGTVAELADAFHISIQNASYHLDNLRDNDLFEVRDTVYSEKGREMDVFGLPEKPLLVFFGPADDRRELQSAFEEFSAAIGPIAVVISLKQALFDLFNVGDWL